MKRFLHNSLVTLGGCAVGAALFLIAWFVLHCLELWIASIPRSVQ